MYYVYVLISGMHSYVGITSNVSRRLAEHNAGKSTYTRRHTPWTLTYTERFDSRSKAREREKYLKSAAGRAFLKVQVFKK